MPRAGNNICADDGGACTLRAAVMEANAHAGPDTILLPADTIHLSRAGAGENLADTGDLDLQGTVTLQGMGAGASIVEAAGLGDRVFDVLTGTTASLSQITIRGGRVLTNNDSGGGVQNWGTLSLTQVLITKNNLATGLADFGGGLANRSLGVLALSNSQVISNSAWQGGGISNEGQMSISGSHVISNTSIHGGTVDNRGGLAISATQVLSNSSEAVGGGLLNLGPAMVSHSTFAGNHAGQRGGGVYTEQPITMSYSTLMGNSAGTEGGGINLASGALALANVTLALNTANGSGGGLANEGGTLVGYNLTIAANTALSNNTGGGLYHESGTTTLRNSVLAYNRRFFHGFFLPSDCSGTFGTFHYSLVSTDAGCSFTNVNTLIGVDPLLLPLAANGGPTLTRALRPGSPALDAADPAGCASPLGGLLLTDQRGYGRHVDGNHDGAARCDMGAYELQRTLFLPLAVR